MSLFLVGGALSAFAQNYVEKQGRTIEPIQEVFIRPLVADLQLIKPDRQEYGPYHFDVDVSRMTEETLAYIKAAAIYNASEEDNADMIVGTTFNISTPKKGGGLNVSLRGYPVVYTNWRSFGEGNKGDDYRWSDDLLTAFRMRQAAAGSEARDAAVRVR